MKTIIALITLLSFFNYEKVELRSANNSSITVKGTSTMHDWELTSSQMDASAVILTDGQDIKVDSFVGILDVTSLKSGKDQMDKNAYKTLNYKDFPQIKFSLVKVVKADKENQKVIGLFNVEISGNSKEVEIEAAAIPVENDGVQITGTKELKMTDFGIKPPSFMLGALKTGNEITVDFDIHLHVGNTSAPHL
ncbi:YceI family protein [bacterium]|nr:MAG: YceI family protein [bacterium]